jgi:hypothetical protein
MVSRVLPSTGGAVVRFHLLETDPPLEPRTGDSPKIQSVASIKRKLQATPMRPYSINYIRRYCFKRLT